MPLYKGTHKVYKIYLRDKNTNEITEINLLKTNNEEPVHKRVDITYNYKSPQTYSEKNTWGISLLEPAIVEPNNYQDFILGWSPTDDPQDLTDFPVLAPFQNTEYYLIWKHGERPETNTNPGITETLKLSGVANIEQGKGVLFEQNSLTSEARLSGELSTELRAYILNEIEGLELWTKLEGETTYGINPGKLFSTLVNSTITLEGTINHVIDKTFGVTVEQFYSRADLTGAIDLVLQQLSQSIVSEINSVLGLTGTIDLSNNYGNLKLQEMLSETMLSGTTELTLQALSRYIINNLTTTTELTGATTYEANYGNLELQEILSKTKLSGIVGVTLQALSYYLINNIAATTELTGKADVILQTYTKHIIDSIAATTELAGTTDLSSNYGNLELQEMLSETMLSGIVEAITKVYSQHIVGNLNTSNKLSGELKYDLEITPPPVIKTEPPTLSGLGCVAQSNGTSRITVMVKNNDTEAVDIFFDYRPNSAGTLAPGAQAVFTALEVPGISPGDTTVIAQAKATNKDRSNSSSISRTLMFCLGIPES